MTTREHSSSSSPSGGIRQEAASALQSARVYLVNNGWGEKHGPRYIAPVADALRSVLAELAALRQQQEGWRGIREALDSVMQRRGVPILEHVRAKDRLLGYQVGTLLGEIARIANINDPSLDAVPLPSPPSDPQP